MPTALMEAANSWLSDHEVPGLPLSGVKEPEKAAGRAVMALIDATLGSLGVNGAITVKKSTLAALNADLAHAADSLAVVYNDAVSANNGIYAKSGASGSGSWAKTGLALPATFASDLALVLSKVSQVDAAVATAETWKTQSQTAATTSTLNAAEALASAAAAAGAAQLVAAAVEVAGVSKFYDTKAAATADLANIAANAVVHVFADEGYSGHRTAYRKESGSLVFKLDLDLALMALNAGQTIVNAADYVDPMQGIMADTLALRAARDAAGSRGTVRGRAGKTFTVYGSSGLQFGQVWDGMGAKIKRGDAITTTTTSGITEGVSNSVTVASASSFRVGMDIAVQSSPTAGTGNRRITSIVGNTITVSAVFDATISSGATLTTSFACIENSGNVGPAVVRGWEMDGNKANNSGFTRWPNHKEIALYGTGCRVEHNYIHDCVGEGIEIGAAATAEEGPCWANANRIEECNGNGIHTSATYAARILFNFIRNTNLRPNGDIGHDDGCISFSDYTGHTEVIGNHLEGGKCGVGSIDAAWNGSLTVALNHIVDCDRPFEGLLPGETVSRVLIKDNLVEDCGEFDINETSGDAADGARDWIVSGNLFLNTRLFGQRAQGLKLSGNVFVWTTDTTALVVDLANLKNSEVEHNRIVGGGYGIYVQGAGTEDLSLTGNRCRDQYTAGVFCASDLPVGEVDISDQRITVASGVSTAAGWVGVQLANGCSLRGGKIKAANTSTGAGVVCPNGGTGVRGALVTGMVIDAPNVSHAVRAFGGSKNNIVVGNFSEQPFTNGGGSDNTFADNYDLTPA